VREEEERKERRKAGEKYYYYCFTPGCRDPGTPKCWSNEIIPCGGTE